MARLCSNLLLVALCYMLVTGYKRTFRSVFKPYGPRMCADLSKDSDYTFHFVKEDLACQRTDLNCSRSWCNRSTEDLLSPSETDNMMISQADTASHEIPNNDSEDDSAEVTTKLHLELPSPSPCNRHLELDLSPSNMSLHQACEEGRLCTVKYILSHGLEDINCQGQNGTTPVMVAAMRGQTAVFDFLVSHNCNLSYTDDHNDTILHSACCGGSTYIVEKLLVLRKYDLEARGWKGCTPVMLAVYHGHRAVFDILVGKGSDLTAVDGRRMNILHFACRCGDVYIVEYILSQKLFGLESRDKYGMTPVMIASMAGRVEVVEVLKQKGCRIKVVDYDGNNILHLACFHGRIEMVKYILQKAFLDIDSRNVNGHTPVIFAAVNRYLDVVDLLLRSNISLTQSDVRENNILHLMSMQGHVDIVKVILAQKTVSIESRGRGGNAAVLLAAGYGQKGVIQVLAREGCNLTTVDDGGNNILHMACESGNVGVVKYVLAPNAVSIDSSNLQNRTPVMIAGWRGHVNIVKYLRGEGCNLTKLDDNRNNILHLISFHGHIEMIKYILTVSRLELNSRGSAGRTPVMIAAGKGHMRVVDLLLHKGCNLTLLDDYKNNILHMASVGGHTEMVNYILSMGIVRINSRGWAGRTPVMLAAVNGFTDVVDLLFKKGCNITLLDADKNNILHLACMGGHVDMVNYILISHKVDIDGRGMKGRTPVMVAVGKNQREVVKLLGRKGCNVRAVDDNGDNVLHLACRFNHVDMVKYIIRHRLVDEKQTNRDGRTALQIAGKHGHSDIISLLRKL